jgi:hypothetical protein
MGAWDLVNNCTLCLPLFHDRVPWLDKDGKPKYRRGKPLTRCALGEGMGLREFLIWREISSLETVSIIAQIAAGEIKDDSADGLEARCWAGAPRLGYLAGMSTTDAYRAIYTLTKLGYLDKPVKRLYRDHLRHYRRVNKQRLETMLASLKDSKEAWEASRTKKDKEDDVILPPEVERVAGNEVEDDDDEDKYSPIPYDSRNEFEFPAEEAA